MRRGVTNSKIIQDENIFYGISLGADFTSEHEWGIDGIISLMGMDKNKMGVDARTISTKDNNIIFYKKDNNAYLVSKTSWRKDEDEIKYLDSNRELSIYRDDFATAWSEKDFGIHVSGETNIVLLEELYNAFKTNNIVITYLSPTIKAFENASLSILIKDRLPKESIEAMYNVDKKHIDLYKYEEKIGLKKLKEKTRPKSYKGEKYFMACSPKWINYEDKELRDKRKAELQTEYDIQYWVNYSDDDNNYGWYTVEKIKKWLSTPGLTLKSLN